MLFSSARLSLTLSAESLSTPAAISSSRSGLISLATNAGILDWFTILVGLLALSALLVHGSLWVALKTTAQVQLRSLNVARNAWWFVLLLTIVVTIASFRIQPHIAVRFRESPWGYIFPLFALVALIGVRLAIPRSEFKSFLASSCYLAGMLLTAVFGLFPMVLPARNPSFSLTVPKYPSRRLRSENWNNLVDVRNDSCHWILCLRLSVLCGKSRARKAAEYHRMVSCNAERALTLLHARRSLNLCGEQCHESVGPRTSTPLPSRCLSPWWSIPRVHCCARVPALLCREASSHRLPRTKRRLGQRCAVKPRIGDACSSHCASHDQVMALPASNTESELKFISSRTTPLQQGAYPAAISDRRFSSSQVPRNSFPGYVQARNPRNHLSLNSP